MTTGVLFFISPWTPYTLNMTRWQTYYLADSVPDALYALASAPGSASIVGGGTDLLLDIEQGRHPPVHTLVDITRIPEMVAVEEREDATIFVGAAAPLYHLVASPLLALHAPALVEACELIGGPQVRNTATLGGNVAHALPAGDGAIALIALDARAEVAGREGRRHVLVSDLYRGPGQSNLDPTADLLVGFHLPMRRPGQSSAFRRVMRPQGVAIAILNMGVWLWREGECIAEIRLAAGPSGPTPRRLRATENTMTGQPLIEATLTRALDALLAETRFRSSPHRASASYRHHLAGVLLHETVHAAWERAVAP